MLFKITNGAVSFGADTVLERIDFEIKDREKIAIVGRNGSGKTTLLKCVTGDVTLEEGTGETGFTVTKTGAPVIGYLKQIAFSDEDETLLNEVLKVFKNITDIESKLAVLLKEIELNPTEEKVKEYSLLNDRYDFLGGYTYKKEYSVMIKKFGFTEEDKHKKLREFSGGQRTKIAFIKLLLSHPDVLLLDEPTNHLDITAVKWLEGYLKSYKSAVVTVSHDRMFVDRTVDKVYEIEYGETKCYHGNYTSFERQKKENYQKQLKDHEYQAEEIKRLTRLIERFRYKATKAKMVQSKIKLLDRMKIIDKPDRYDLKSFHANFQPKLESVKNVLTVKDLVIGYDKPLGTVNLELFKGQKLGVIGDNGVGKSTFLKTICSKILPLSGSFTYGLNTEVGYFDQKMAEYVSDKSVYDDFYDDFPHLTETEVRSSLGAFLFTGDDVFKKVSDLSGGERVRLALCKIFKRKPNVLILDEPTNHMDIVGKETLENMLLGYKGTVIFVSHDRYFVNKVADKILAFEGDGAKFYPINYSEYEEILDKRILEEDAKLNQQKNTVTPVTGAKKTFSTPLKDRSKKQKRVEKISKELEILEAEVASINALLESPKVYSDYVKVTELNDRLIVLTKNIDDLSTEWLTLSEELDIL
ncbi:MAG: ABC-F type ribosomal protection protein [Clostridia bacterium]|nr:ABC-F type ribosomal protection protein [Clostridia bacterium]